MKDDNDDFVRKLLHPDAVVIREKALSPDMDTLKGAAVMSVVSASVMSTVCILCDVAVSAMVRLSPFTTGTSSVREH